MVRFLLLIGALLLAGCYPAAKVESPKVEPSPGYVNERDLPEKFKASEFPRIIIDDVALWLDPHMPGWEESGGGYRTVQFNCPVAWFDLGGDRTLSDGTDFRSADASLYKEFANVNGDIMVRHREGVMQIMDGGLWRNVRVGDRVRPAAILSLLGEAKDLDFDGKKREFGTSGIWAKFSENARAWVISELPTPESDDTETRLRNGERVEYTNGTYEEIVPFASVNQDGEWKLHQAAVESQQRDSKANLVAVEALIARLRSELHAAEELKQLLSAEQNAADKAKQEADAIRDNSISQNWRDAPPHGLRTVEAITESGELIRAFESTNGGRN
jgi:hypothetical protein